MFRLEILDEILMSRLAKNKDENKFIYLMQTYRRLENHLYTKTTSNPIITSEQILDAKEQIVSFFNTLLQCPETFEINNDKVENVLDNEAGGVMNQNDMLMALMGGQGGGFGQAFLEKLCSNKYFQFTPMQTQLYEAFEKEAISLHTEFIKSLVNIVKEDQD